MNDAEGTFWLRCDKGNSHFLGGWAFHPGTRCADIPCGLGDQQVKCAGILVEVQSGNGCA